LALVTVSASLGCVTIPVAATVVTEPGRRVTAEASTFSVFWLSPLPVETAGDLIDDLVEQCDGADLTGVTVATEIGWAVIGQQETMTASGYCVDPGRGG
jgi:hypothetical protein